MAQPRSHPNALLIAAAFSKHDSALDWSLEQLSIPFGPPRLCSQRFDHHETKYYESEMGTGLKKQFFVWDALYDPQRLPSTKLFTNELEAQLARTGSYPEPRPVNIDPGYLTLTKLVLASAKDRAHRLYMADGIYAEECLYYLDHRWQPRPWTYPDYQRAEFHAFFIEARQLLKHSPAR